MVVGKQEPTQTQTKKEEEAKEPEKSAETLEKEALTKAEAEGTLTGESATRLSNLRNKGV